MAEACREELCCPPSDFDHAAVDSSNCPPGYIWNGEECVPDACVVTTTSLADGGLGGNYSESVSATGFEMFTWTIVGGSLPTGLTMDASGNITGIPTASGVFDFVVQATPVI